MSKSLSIDQFCEAEGISRPMWYLLRARGETPEIYKVGTRTRISPEAHQAWRKARAEAASRERAA